MYDVKFIVDVDVKKIVENREVILITKKQRREIEAFCCWYDTERNIMCCEYINKWGKLDIKQFDMRNYDFCLA